MINLKDIDGDKLLKWGKVAGIVLIAIIIILVFVYSIKSIKRFFGFSDKGDGKAFESREFLDGLTVDGDFPDELASYVTELDEALSSWMIDASPRCDAYKRLMELNDNEFIAVMNAYYKTYGRSVRSDMNKTVQSGCSALGTKWNEKVRERMHRLGTI